MRRSVAVLAILSICTHAWIRSAHSQRAPAPNPAEQEIRAALCELEQHDYVAAQARLERVLDADSGNIYARKVLLGLLAREIKPGDNSPPNIAFIRKAIEGYSRAAKNSQFSAKEKRQIERYL